jgi:Ulp1 family protease
MPQFAGKIQGLSVTDNGRVASLWDNPLNSAEPVGSSQIGRDSFCRLESPKWLNDDVIDSFFDVLRENELERRKPKLGSMYYKCQFMSCLVREDVVNPSVRTYGYEGMEGWTHGINIFSLKRLYIPINARTTHWTLAVVDIAEHTIRYFDSSPSERINPFGEQTLLYLQRYLFDEFSVQCPNETWVDWKVHHMRGLPGKIMGMIVESLYV